MLSCQHQQSFNGVMQQTECKKEWLCTATMLWHFLLQNRLQTNVIVPKNNTRLEMEWPASGVVVAATLGCLKSGTASHLKTNLLKTLPSPCLLVLPHLCFPPPHSTPPPACYSYVHGHASLLFTNYVLSCYLYSKPPPSHIYIMIIMSESSSSFFRRKYIYWSWTF